MKPWQTVLLTFVSVWVIGNIVGTPRLDNLVFSIAMALAIAIHENIHITLWHKITGSKISC